MTEPDSTKPTTSPLRWVLLVVVIVLTGFAVYAASALTERMNTTASTVPTRSIPSAPDGSVCPVSPDVHLQERVDVRIQAAQGDGLQIARRTTADVDADGLHLPAGTPFGTGTISLGNANYATFEFTDAGCTLIVPRPPEPDATADEDTL